MHICIIGKHTYPKDIFSNEQDMKTWRSLAIYFNRLFVIASSPDLFFHSIKEKNINIYLVPNILSYIGFIVGAVKIGFYLNIKYGIDVFDASEIAGGGTAATFLKFLTGKSTVIEVQGEIFRGLRCNNTNSASYNANDANCEYNRRLVISGISNKLLNWHYYKSLLLQKIGKWTMKRATRVRVISNAIFDQIKEQGIPESKIRLVSLRVDLSLFVSKSDFDTFGDKVGITLGYIGRLVDGKGLEDLFEAVKILKNRELNVNQNIGSSDELGGWKLVIYGTGPIEERLKKMAEELKIVDKIEWRGFVLYGKVPEALTQIDIFVYPSWHEGFGRSIMEALAMEKAVVATRVGGIPDLIKNGENGFLVAPHNPEALALKIKELMENTDLREEFGKAGREFVNKNYEWNDGIKKFANLFLELKK